MKNTLAYYNVAVKKFIVHARIRKNVDISKSNASWQIQFWTSTIILNAYADCHNSECHNNFKARLGTYLYEESRKVVQPSLQILD